jgi:hypothetical protein
VALPAFFMRSKRDGVLRYTGGRVPWGRGPVGWGLEQRLSSSQLPVVLKGADGLPYALAAAYGVSLCMDGGPTQQRTQRSRSHAVRVLSFKSGVLAARPCLPAGSHRADPLRRTRSSRKSTEPEGAGAAASPAVADQLLNSGFPGFPVNEPGAPAAAPVAAPAQAQQAAAAGGCGAGRGLTLAATRSASHWEQKTMTGWLAAGLLEKPYGATVWHNLSQPAGELFWPVHVANGRADGAALHAKHSWRGAGPSSCLSKASEKGTLLLLCLLCLQAEGQRL